MNEKNADFWHKIGYVKASNYRINVIRELKGGPKTPNEISQNLNYHISHVSNTLSELEQTHLVKCLTPELRKGKLFGITKYGIEILKKI